MNRWEDLVKDFERAIVESRPEVAARLLGEFALTAPASIVRRHHHFMVEASARCPEERTRAQLIASLEFLRQRAAITESSLNVLAPQRPSKKVTRAKPPARKRGARRAA
jgi:hypothetical protein